MSKPCRDNTQPRVPKHHALYVKMFGPAVVKPLKCAPNTFGEEDPEEFQRVTKEAKKRYQGNQTALPNPFAFYGS